MGRVLVIGLGSAGMRHAEILKTQGHDVITVSRRPGAGDYAVIRDAVLDRRPGYTVVASETAAHLEHLQELWEAGFHGPVLMEKPLFRDWSDGADLSIGSEIFVGYNLRFDPVIRHLQARLAELEEPLVSVRIEVGQYLPDWRRSRDVKETYSASSAAGGGVLRDLSHELDLAMLLCGPWNSLTALGGRLGGFEITSDDSWTIMASMSNCPQLSIRMNYFDRPARRSILVNGTHTTLEADLIAGRLCVNGELEHIHREDLQSYKDQLEAFMGGPGHNRLCDLSTGMAVMAMIRDVERADRTGTWVQREGAV
ncbi:Gfo/Idh/MocA family protein [Aestuariispira insulae]|uniref:Putative dehydrogenase n=1 Tax=Aestuariispira insulae TaxID=1461337 RepID=A0A3D9HX68_9PROT|nr:Gfo/Idh/MocA family oxidoreductase [Aestuariispira insulae]RED54102.1 putative dehydrogenase [Aestuariispira insulae]